MSLFTVLLTFTTANLTLDLTFLQSPGSSETAVQTLAVAAGRHLEALGRSFRMHLDGGLGMLTETEPEVGTSFEAGPECCSEFSNLQDIVRLSLAENGTTTQDLESHVVDDIVKHGSKLDEMLRKLKTAYDDYVSLGLQRCFRSVLDRLTSVLTTTRLGPRCTCGCRRRGRRGGRFVIVSVPRFGS